MNKNVVTWQRNHKKYMEISLKVNVSKIIARLSFILNIIELKKQKKKKTEAAIRKAGLRNCCCGNFKMQAASYNLDRIYGKCKQIS